MKSIPIAALATALLLIACKQSGQETGAAPATPADSPTAAATSAPAADAKPYPLDTCIVSGEKLGSMGTPVVMTHEGQEIKFCCKSCRPDFQKEPAKYLAKLAN